jgi:hypothetical protein
MGERKFPSERICPECNGTGRTKGPVHINRGDHPHEWRESMKCFCCRGVRYISQAHWDARERGAELRKERIARGESLFEASKRQGISSSELSRIERGGPFSIDP